jgi:hypothetical protein
MSFWTSADVSPLLTAFPDRAFSTLFRRSSKRLFAAGLFFVMVPPVFHQKKGTVLFIAATFLFPLIFFLIASSNIYFPVNKKNRSLFPRPSFPDLERSPHM